MDIPLNVDAYLLAYLVNIKAVKDVNVKGIVNYHPNLNAINIKATIVGEVVVEDARTLEHFVVPINLLEMMNIVLNFFKKAILIT